MENIEQTIYEVDEVVAPTGQFPHPFGVKFAIGRRAFYLATVSGSGPGLKVAEALEKLQDTTKKYQDGEIKFTELIREKHKFSLSVLALQYGDKIVEEVEASNDLSGDVYEYLILTVSGMYKPEIRVVGKKK